MDQQDLTTITFMVDNKKYSVEKLEQTKNTQLKLMFDNMITQYYLRIRHMTCDLKCGSPRDYATVISRLDYDKITRNINELTNNHIDYILRRIKIIHPTLK